MTPATTRALRRAFLGLALSVLVAVGWTLRPPAKRASAPSPAEAPPRGAKDETRTTGLVFRSFKEGEQSFVLEAESSAAREQAGSRLRGVKLTFGYKGEERQGSAVITSDECNYDPQLPKAVFTGHVVLTTDDGLQLKTESLVYRGDKGLARTEDPVEFRRNDMSGSSTGAVYSAEQGEVELSADARVRIEGTGGQPPTEIRSRQAFLAKSEGEARFLDDVEVRQASDTLRSDRLFLTFDPETHVVSRAIAAGGVDLQTQGGRPLPGFPPEAGKGPRRLTSRKLDITFRPNHTMEQMIAQNDVDLLLLPGPGEAPERRRVKAEVYLIFDCDEQGRIVALRAQKNASLMAEPVKKGQTPTRTARCNHFEATVDPDSGDVRAADFLENVTFTRDSQTATARNAHYDGSASVLALEGAPQVVDDQGTLNARAIRLRTKSGGVEAEEDVHHVLKSEGHSGLFGGDSPTLITSRTFSSTSNPQTATYTGDALLRSGKDEVRAASLFVEAETEGRRRLTARESVASILHPRSETPGTRAAAAMEGRADLMEYDEAKGLIVYTGNAVMRQADITTRSPKATLTLTADGSGIEKMVAGEPVEVEQGERHGTGTTGTYTPGDGTVVLVGDNVVVKDPQQLSRGRSVTFHMDDDRILVDGQEQVRTETVFQNAPGRP